MPEFEKWLLFNRRNQDIAIKDYRTVEQVHKKHSLNFQSSPNNEIAKMKISHIAKSILAK